MVWSCLSEAEVPIVERGEDIETDYLCQEVVEGVSVHWEVDVVHGKMGNDLHCIDSSPDRLHIQIDNRREKQAQNSCTFRLCFKPI